MGITRQHNFGQRNKAYWAITWLVSATIILLYTIFQLPFTSPIFTRQKTFEKNKLEKCSLNKLLTLN